MSLSYSPRVSICVPVRNGQKYLRDCLDSILAQTFTDFELILCDNASTDATPSICREYAARDPRVRYIRHARNIGPSANFNSGVGLARGEYFRWQAHDDLIAPEYLQRCVEVLDREPGAVLVYPKTTVIDDAGEPVERYEFAVDTNASGVCRRFRQLVMVRNRQHRNFEVFGLMRTSAMQRTPLQECYAHGDRVFIVRMALLGRLHPIEQHLFLARRHASQSMQTLPARAGIRSRLTRWLGPGPLPPPEWWDPAMKDRMVFPDWNLLRQYARSVRLAPLSLAQRIGCCLSLAEWTIRYWPKLVRDIAFAGELLASRMTRSLESGSAGEAPSARDVSGVPEHAPETAG